VVKENDRFLDGHDGDKTCQMNKGVFWRGPFYNQSTKSSLSVKKETG